MIECDHPEKTRKSSGRKRDGEKFRKISL